MPRLAPALVPLLLTLSMLVGGCGEAGPPDRAVSRGPVPTPEAVADLPVGPPTTYPWLGGGAVHVGANAVGTDADQLLHRGGATLLGRADDRGSTWWLLDGGRLLPLISDRTPDLEPALSADGGTAAWSIEVSSAARDGQQRRTEWEVVAFDVPTRSVLGMIRLGGDVTCCDTGRGLRVIGVTNDGRVILSGGPAGRLSVWRAGDPLVGVRVDAHPDVEPFVGADTWPLGVSYALDRDTTRRVRYGRVDALGVVTEVGRVSASALWSADGRRVADRVLDAATGTARVVVTVPVTGETVGLALPPASDWQLLGWEDEGHVIAARGSTTGSSAPTYTLVRCEVGRGACELAGESAA